MEEIINRAHKVLEEYKEGVKHKNRFFIDEKIKRIFDDIINNCQQTIEEKTQLFRARINETDRKEPYPVDKMGKPPLELSGNGRLNPKGISILYLAGGQDTCIAEVRPSIDNVITIGKFNVNKKIKVVKFWDGNSVITEKQKFTSGESVEFLAIFAALLGKEFSKPILPNQRDFEYIPTQLFAEYCKSKGIEGIMYKSSVVSPKQMKNNRLDSLYNYVLFDDLGVKCTETYTIKVKEIMYEIEIQKN